MNSRLDTIQAAVLRVKLKAFIAREVEDVNKAARLYTERLKDIVATPVVPEGYLSSWAQYTVRLRDKEERDALQTYLKENGIPSMVYYPKPLHRQVAYRDLDLPELYCPVAGRLCDTVLSLPIHPYLTPEEIHRVCDAVQGYLHRR